MLTPPCKTTLMYSYTHFEVTCLGRLVDTKWERDFIMCTCCQKYKKGSRTRERKRERVWEREREREREYKVHMYYHLFLFLFL